MKKVLLLALTILIVIVLSGCHNGDNDNNDNNNGDDHMDTWFAYFQSGNSIRVRTAPVTKTGGEVDVPRDADWTDRGVAISPGGSGSWDVRLTGALSPCTVVKKNGTFFLYYIGADGNRKSDGGPRHRALGVATSSNGINFTKRGRILTYLPHNNEEEGIFSAGAFLDVNGEVVLYYSALDAGSPTSTTVDSDIRLAVSSNGLNFADKGDVLSHADSRVWGYGDELFPVGTFREGSTYYLYYITKGVGTYWDLGLAQGSSRNNIAGNTQQVLRSGPDNFKSGCPMRLSTSKIVVSICRNTTTEERTASISSPQTLSAPVETYTTRTGGVYLDAPITPPYTKKTITCPQCGSSLELTISSVEAENIPQICPVCGEPVGTGYTVAIITELPWPIYTTKSIICPQCNSELELTISSKPEENIPQICPVCGAPAD